MPVSATLADVKARVWVDAWQMQCCGTPFADGDTVDWVLSTGYDPEWLEHVAGPEVARSVDFSEERHGPHPDDASITTGVVIAILAVRCRFEPDPDGPPNQWHPVRGSGQLTLTHTADGWETEEGGLHFNGYIVDLAASKLRCTDSL
jgi:hypothetical protein